LASVAPPTAPSVAGVAGGNLSAGAYLWAVTFCGPWGESDLGTPAGFTATAGQAANLSSIPTGPAGTLFRNIYRTPVGGGPGTFQFVGSLLDNSTTTFTDSLADVSLGGNAPSPSFGADLTVYQVALSPAQVAANTTAEQTFTVSGVGVQDKVIAVIKPTAQAGLGIVGHRVSAANTVAITFSNNTAAGITPTAAETYLIVVLRS
jgi:hypothetical protein